ncbi:hypothetical protein M422DRAFT_255743 [Sphaerobolus stellatus SS14]|uniref:Uncharacterized protein n=1 Tax=Sphaerobolus stellatus (strain SS14) TaxID=990650 RepID=A0A0C9UDV7_SPHS4|nr:hypothetical protein M422DRAFT_255743 [Sphaerobolus stellatus SS14]
MADIEDSEPTTGLTTGDLTNSPSPSVDPQQSPQMLLLEHPEDPHATAHGSQTAPSREQSPSRGCYSPQGIEHRSELCSDSGQVSPTRGDTKENFIIPASEVVVLRQEYSEFITLKDNAEIVLAEAMEVTEQLNTVFIPSNQMFGKTCEPGNNWAHDRAAAQAATQCIIDQTSMADPAPGSGAEERMRTMRSCISGDPYSQAPLSWNIPEDIPHSAHSEQGEDSQLRCGREAHTVHSLSANRVIQGIPESIECSGRSIAEPQSIDMNALREEIKATISANIKEKLCSDADSVTTVSQSMQALDSNAQYWSNLSNKAMRRSRRALELQLKLAEEKINSLLHEEAPEEALLEAACEVCSIRFQLDQSSQLREAGLMPEQQVQFSANTGRNIVSPARNYGPNPIIEPHIPQSEVNAQFG